MRKSLGFNLVELLIVLLLLSITTSWVLSGLSNQLARHQLAMVERTLIAAIDYAKNQSLISNRSVTLAPLRGYDWSSGLILFIDTPSHHHQSTDPILYQWDFPQSPVQLRWAGFLSADFILFSNQLDKMACNGHFEIENKALRQRIIINRIGRVRSTSIERSTSSRTPYVMSNALRHVERSTSCRTQ